jgi:hypothetical protein
MTRLASSFLVPFEVASHKLYSRLANCRRMHRSLMPILPLLSFVLFSAFQASATPKITVMTPSGGPVGTLVVIVGSGFGTTQGTSTVTFNGIPVTWVSWGSTTLEVQVPAGATTGSVVVKVSGASSNGEAFTVTAPPVITNMSPTSGAVGSSVTITGSGFSAGGTQTPQVVFNPQLYATPTTSSDTSITVAVPPGATTGDVVVSVGGGSSNAELFTVTSSDPSINSISPSGGTIGTSVTITGSNFGSPQGSSTVTFNGTTASPTSWSASSIVVPVPTGATTGNVIVTVAGVASNPYGFEVGTAAPSITSISPTSGAVGTATTITGKNFGSSQGSSTVNFNGVSGIPTSWSATSIKVPVPSGATTGNVVVVVGANTSNGVAFTVPGTGPSISGLSQTSGPVGSSVTITGTNFGQIQGNSTVTFGGVAASATGWSPTSILATVPSGAATGNIVVTANGTSSNGVGFTVSPYITTLSPTSGIVGSSVTITGTSFGSSQGTVTFNGTTSSPTSWSTGSIVVPVPAGATTGNVVVTASGVASNGVGFTVAPNITGISPNPAVVGTTVTISGSGFGPGPGTVTFNGTTATPSSWSSSSITVPVPTGATTGNVVVTVSGTASNGVTFTVQSLGFVTTAGQMAAARYGQTATQLSNGQILVAGGTNSSGVLNEAEIYTLSSQTFAATANPMNVPRWLHTATLLNDGTVLIAGGSDLANEETLDTAEIYNPAAGTFTLLTSTLNTARVGHTATLLQNGQVLIVGGYDPQYGLIVDAELYDPPTQAFIDLGDTNAPRYEHTATMLQNGQVLIAGGETDPTPSAAFSSAELFNLANQAFTLVPVPMTTPREGHAAVLLNNGQVLITGGDNPPTGSQSSAEIYDPASNTFLAVSSTMTAPRTSHLMTLLNGGNVLIMGGATDSGGGSTPLNTAEIYNSATQSFSATSGNMTSVRVHGTASLLNNGTVLLAGGTDGTNIFNTAELYMPSQLSGLTSIAVAPANPSVATGAQQAFTAVGTFSDGSNASLASVLWSSSNTSVAPISNDATDSGAAASIAQGTVTVTATSGSVSGSATLTVTAPTLASIQLSPQSPTIPLGSTQQFTATGVYTDGSTQNLTNSATWSSSASAVAAINTSGVSTGLFQGVATIQASLGSVNATTNLSVSEAALVSIAVTPTTSSIPLGSSQQYQAIGTYSDGSTQNVTTLLTWSSATPTVATISDAGLATSVSQGTASLTGTFAAISASVSLTVAAPNLVSITVVPNVGTLSTGGTQQLTATGIYTDGTTQNLTASSTWTSSNSSAIGVSNSGVATAAATGSATITAMSGSISGTAVLIVTAGTTNLNTSRYEHNATMLNNGQILVAGGVTCAVAGSCMYLNSSELYNPASGAFTYTGSMATARSAPAVLLNNGNVLVAGGYTCDNSGNCSSLISAEIYDPTTASFTSTEPMTMARSGHTMTVLGNGTVLIAGGEDCTSTTSCAALSSAEIYDPNAGTFTPTSNGMSAARFGASAVLLDSGSVLIVGGFDGANLPAAAEIYSPGTNNTFTWAGGSLNVPRFGATSTLLNNGQVLVAGGSTCASGCPTNAAEIYDPIANTFTNVAGGMTTPRFNHSATSLTNGDIVVAGGFSSCSSSCNEAIASTEFFDPIARQFTSSQAVANALAGHTGTLTANGDVLLIGGINDGVTLATDQWYQPTNLTPTGLVSITVAPNSVSLMAGQTQALVATGTFGDGTTQTLQSVIWNSSNPSVATVSNSPGSAGIANALTTGSSTVTAAAGTVTGSVPLYVAQLASLTIGPANPSTSVGSGLQLTASGTFLDDSVHDLTSSVTWSSSNSNTVLFGASSNGLPGFALGVASGTAIVTAALGGIQATTQVTVQSPSLPTTPAITTVSPSAGAAGTQVTITGSGFGSAQGTGSVWLGSTFAAVASWTNTQIVATVATNATSGMAQVQQGGLSSNAVPFNVSTATISSISPTSGVPGTQVSINGSGFGATQGSGQVWLGTANGVVQSWSNTQVVAVVATGSASGNGQILQNGVMSNAVPFAVNSLHISNVTPNSGGPGTVVTISGTGFGSNQGNGTVLLGSASGQVVSWSNTQLVAAVAPNALTGVVRVEQNAVLSNAVTFTVPSSGGPFSGSNSVTVVPNLINLVVGGTQPIEAVNSNGQSVTGLTWTSSNTSVATLSIDDPPIISGVGTGSATITAGNASANVTVSTGTGGTGATSTTLPAGTVIWSNPGDGSGVQCILPAIPSSTGVADVFALNNDGNVQAITSNGMTAWTVNVGTSITCSNLIPDFLGGLVVANVASQPPSIMEIGGTGVVNPPYTAANPNDTLSAPAVHPDGTIFTVYTDNTANTASVIGISPMTGTQLFGAALDQSVSSNTSNYSGMEEQYCPSGPPTPDGGQVTYSPALVAAGPIIAGDGFAYVAYEYSVENSVSQGSYVCYGDAYVEGETSNTTTTTAAPLMLMRVGADGSSSKIDVQDWNSTYVNNFTFQGYANAPPTSSGSMVQSAPVPYNLPVNMITNADTGVLLTWEADVQQYCSSSSGYSPSVCNNTVPAASTFGLATTSGSSLTSSTMINIPGEASPILPVLQLQDGTFAGTVGLGPQPGQVTQTNMIGFDSAGNVTWSVPNDSPQIATNGGGMIGTSGATYDNDGNVTGLVASLPVQSWSGSSYQLGSVEQISPECLFDLGAESSSSTDATPCLTPSYDADAGPGPGPQKTAAANIAFQKQVAVATVAPGTSTTVPNSLTTMTLPLDSLNGIALDQTENVLVTIAKGSGPLTLSLVASGTNTATNKAQFANGTTTTQFPPSGGKLTQVKGGGMQGVVQITGMASSDKADDVTLTATTSNGNSYGSQKFSVVSVFITVNTGAIQQNDLASSLFATSTGQAKAAQVHLGQVFDASGQSTPNQCGIAIEYIGQVTPSDYKGKITLRRTASPVTYTWNMSNPTASPIQPPPSSEDTSRYNLLSQVPATSTTPSGSFVYDIDVAGPLINTLQANFAISYRANFQEYAQLGDWGQGLIASPNGQLSGIFSSPETVSLPINSFARASCNTSASGGPAWNNTFAGDNSGGPNCTQTTLDLSGPPSGNCN